VTSKSILRSSNIVTSACGQYMFPGNMVWYCPQTFKRKKRGWNWKYIIMYIYCARKFAPISGYFPHIFLYNLTKITIQEFLRHLILPIDSHCKISWQREFNSWYFFISCFWPDCARRCRYISRTGPFVFLRCKYTFFLLVEL
jgi:hypothetical protein